MFSWCCSFPQSPFPEFKGHFEKENSHMTPGNVKTSLTFSDASPKSAPSAPIQCLKVSPVSLLRPGEVLEIQKQLTPQVARQKKLTAENASMVSHLPEEGECVQPCFSIHSIVLAFIFQIVVLQYGVLWWPVGSLLSLTIKPCT